MTIRKATELVRQFALELSMDDLDFSDLSFSLLVDDRSVTVEYLPNSDQFLIYGPVASDIDMKHTAAMTFVQDAAHAIAMEGGGALTVDRHTRRVIFSQTVARELLDANELGLCISGVSALIGEFSAGLKERLSQAPQDDHSAEFTLRL